MFVLKRTQFTGVVNLHLDERKETKLLLVSFCFLKALLVKEKLQLRIIKLYESHTLRKAPQCFRALQWPAIC